MSAPVHREGDTNLGTARRSWDRRTVGHRTRALLERDTSAFLHQSLSTPCLSAVVGAEGSWIVDADGRRYLDLHGNSSHHLGHAAPRVLGAIERQLRELTFAPRRFTCEPAIELAERLAASVPGGPWKVLFTPGGSEAVEVALKVARVATGRYKTVSFWDSFHGAGAAASAVGGEALFRSSRLGPLIAGAEHVAPFDCFRCPYGFSTPSGVPDLDRCAMACARVVAYTLDREEDVAAVIAEPIRAVPNLPPRGFWPAVREACDTAGSLLIFDEISTGLGKTGRWWAHEHADARPDIVVTGKALGGGVLPLAAVLARADLDVAADLALGHYTHEKNPVLASAGLATLDQIVDERLVERAAHAGELFLRGLTDALRGQPLVGNVRGAGLLVGVELVTPGGGPAREAADRVLYACLERGLSFKVTMGNVLTLSAPLTIGDDELDFAVAVLEESLRAVERDAPLG